ncbi:MAG TPA: hypothetical protein VGI10_12555 [Polyangiaceae bacterium]|jgi:hypothetical protein
MIYANGLVPDSRADAPDPKQVADCRRWIRWFVRPRRTINQKRSSYGLKHTVENWAGRYVANGAFIAAAIAEGYRVAQIGQGPNAWFNMGFVRGKQ